MTAGDVIGGSATGYQMSGVPDGIGGYASSASTFEVFVNHELSFADDDPSNARVSHLTLNTAGKVIAASYPIDGAERFEEICSSTLAVLRDTPWYFTGEESPTSPRQGSSLAMNALTGRWVETPWFGHLYHENVVPLDGMSKAAVFISEDGAPLKSQIWVFTANTFRQAIRGTGTLRVFVPTEKTDRSPSPDDVTKADPLRGRLVAVPQSSNTNPYVLERAAQALGSLNLIRIEDATADPANPGTVYLSDTGAGAGAHGQETTRGRIYRLDIDPAHPTRAVLKVVLDGDAGDDLVNPDNLGINDKALVIDEDRNVAKSGFDRVLVYDLASRAFTAVARSDPRPVAIKRAGGRGAWETSGVVDASAFFGAGWWLLDVQASHVSVPVPGRSLRPSSAEGEGGQLLRIYIPGT